MTIAEGDAVLAYPELADLIAIRDLGKWSFRPLQDETGGKLIGLVGWRICREATDALWIYDRDDCRAVRLLDDGPAGQGGVVWDRAGDLTECLIDLMALPEPDAPKAPRLVRAGRLPLWTP